MSDRVRVITLLSVAYDRPVPASALGHIARAAQQWQRGEDCLAAIHLALTGLPKLAAPREAARRLFIADGFLDHGIKAAGIDPAILDELWKYDAAEPRVLPGNGIQSGRWTDEAVSFLTGLSSSTLAAVSGFLGRLSLGETAAAVGETVGEAMGGAVSAFGLILIPTPAGGYAEGGPIAGAPGFSYSWTEDEVELHIFLTGDAGETEVLTAYVGKDDGFYDRAHNLVARL